jgi:CBS domain-containing protein
MANPGRLLRLADEMAGRAAEDEGRPSSDPPRQYRSRGDEPGGRSEKTTAVREVMSTDLVTVELSATVLEAARVMSVARVGSVLVLDAGALAGIFTERDILRAFARQSDTGRVSRVAKWMTRGPVAIGQDASVGEALDRMLEGGFRHLPVK